MAVRKKGRRKIVCGGENYVWYVSKDHDSPLILLHICSEDKRLVLVYPVSSNYIVSTGRVFKGEESHFWRRFFLPVESTECITPGFVRKLIEWTKDGSPAKEPDSKNDIKYTLSCGYAVYADGRRAYTFMY